MLQAGRGASVRHVEPTEGRSSCWGALEKGMRCSFPQFKNPRRFHEISVLRNSRNSTWIFRFRKQVNKTVRIRVDEACIYHSAFQPSPCSILEGNSDGNFTRVQGGVARSSTRQHWPVQRKQGYSPSSATTRVAKCGRFHQPSL